MCCLASASPRNGAAVWRGLPVPTAVLHGENSWKCSTEDVGTSSKMINSLPEPSTGYFIPTISGKWLGLSMVEWCNRALPGLPSASWYQGSTLLLLVQSPKPRTTLNLLFLPNYRHKARLHGFHGLVCGMASVAPFGQHSDGKSPGWMGKSSTKGQFFHPFSITMLVYQSARFP